MNMNREVYEGWTVRDFIEELEPLVQMIMTNNSFVNPFSNKSELKYWLRDNQPYYKRDIPEVIEYFSNKYNLH